LSEQGRGQLLTPSTEDQVMREAELLALRQMADNVAAMTRELVSSREIMTDLRIDMAAIKERQEQHSEFKEFLAELKGITDKLSTRVTAIETRNAQQDGAVGLVQWLKDFGPWLLAIAAVLWSFAKPRL
jgi:hypothetical protein